MSMPQKRHEKPATKNALAEVVLRSDVVPPIRALIFSGIILSAIAHSAMAEPPTVIRSEPANGATDVNPNLSEILVEFDQDMNRGGMSWVAAGGTFPALRGRAAWRNKRVCVLPVTFEPNTEYRLGINSIAYTNFRGTNDEPATPYIIAFTTGAEPDTPDRLTPELNRPSIAELRRAIDEQYSYRDLREIDWDALFAKHAPKLEKSRTPREFAARIAKLLKPAKDIHIVVEAQGKYFPTVRRKIRANINLDTIALSVPNFEQQGNHVSTGRFEDGIAYILIGTWSRQQKTALEPAFDALRKFSEAPGLIVDVRPNAGGDETIARRFAGCFVDAPVVYAKHVTRSIDLPGGFTPPHERVLHPTKDGPKYRGRVAVLMGPKNMSSCEAFLLMMKQAPDCKLIGATSYGASGNPQKVALPNGVIVMLPSWKAMQPDGTEIEGRGIEPDLPVPGRAGKTTDPVLQAALDWLRE